MLVFTSTCKALSNLKQAVAQAPNSHTFEASGGNSTGVKRLCTEAMGLSFCITDWSDRAKMMADNGLSVVFAEADFEDRMSKEPVNPGVAVKFDSVGVLKNYLQSDGKLAYTYSERMYYQIDKIVTLLRDHPETRQAFLSIWDPEIDSDNFETTRVPCSIGFHFLLREGKLNLVYYMRSLEVTQCVGNDIYTSSRMIEAVAEELGVKPGTLTFCVGSAHFFSDKAET